MESGRDIHCLRPASHCFTDPIPYLHENCYLHKDEHQDKGPNVHSSADLDEITHHHAPAVAYANSHTVPHADPHPVTNEDADSLIFQTQVRNE